MIQREKPPSTGKLQKALAEIGFDLPRDLIDFYKNCNGAYLDGDESSAEIWPVTELVENNKNYNSTEFYPDFFLIGSDGIGNAIAIKKSTGQIFEVAWISDPTEDSILIGESFTEFARLRLGL